MLLSKYTITLLALCITAPLISMDLEDPPFTYPLPDDLTPPPMKHETAAALLSEAKPKPLTKTAIFEKQMIDIIRKATPDTAALCEKMAGTKEYSVEDNSHPQIHWSAAGNIGTRDMQQDVATFFNAPAQPFCGACVADGHGPTGHFIAHQVIRNLPSECCKALQEVARDDALEIIKTLFNFAYKKIDANLVKPYHLKRTAEAETITYHGGAVAALALFNEDLTKLYITHAGDCRALLYDYATNTAAWLTTDHRPDSTDEKDRIVKKGGLVIMPPDEPYARIQEGMASASYSSYIGLNTSHSFADTKLKKYGLIVDPDLCVKDIAPTKQLLILCSDGIHDAPRGYSLADTAGRIARIAKEGLELGANPAEYLVTNRPFFDADNATAVVAVINP